MMVMYIHIYREREIETEGERLCSGAKRAAMLRVSFRPLQYSVGYSNTNTLAKDSRARIRLHMKSS